MDKKPASGKVLSLVACGLLLILAYWVEREVNTYWVQVISLWAINVMLAVSFNLIYGYTGQFSLAHAGIIAIGAYTLALLALTPEQKEVYFLIEPAIWPISVIHLPFVPSLILAGLLGVVASLIVAGPALRLHGDYLLIVTLGFSEIIRLVLCNLPSICNGALGLKGIPRQGSLVWIVGLTMLTVFVTKRLVDSSYGRALKCIKEDEIAAEAIGIKLFRHKLLAFVVSAFFAGVAGALLADLLRTVDPGEFRPILTYAIVTMVVLGGVGSITGSILGAGVYTIMSEVLRASEYSQNIFGFRTPNLPGMRMLAFAVMLIGLMLYYRRGLVGRNEFTWEGLFASLRNLSARIQGEKNKP